MPTTVQEELVLVVGQAPELWRRKLHPDELAISAFVLEPDQEAPPRSFRKLAEGLEVRLMLATLEPADRRSACFHPLSKLFLGKVVLDSVLDDEAGQTFERSKGRSRSRVLGFSHSTAPCYAVIRSKRTHYGPAFNGRLWRDPPGCNETQEPFDLGVVTALRYHF